ncbi:MAG TPA: hypothetical protein VJ600_07200 [Holophagaceae bacterium]|nr:hypothetical protein [Holophagaceae bacterium]
MENPYTPPSAEVGDTTLPQDLRGTPLPWEALPRSEGALAATLRVLLQDLPAAGEGLSATGDLIRPLVWYLLLALIPMVVLAVLGILHPIHTFWQAWLGFPVRPAPEGPALVFGLVMVFVGAPIGAAIGMGVTGLVHHACLWLLGGTREKLGLLVTFRSLLYTTGAVTLLVKLPLALLQFLPGSSGYVGQGLVLLSSLATYSYQGLVLARGHRTEGWRGIAAVWIPVLLLFLCCGGAFYALWHFGGEAFQEGFRQTLRGGR